VTSVQVSSLVEPSRRSSARSGAELRLCLVDEQHGAKQRLLDVLLPLRTHGLVRAPAVRGRHGDAEAVADLPVEVGDAALRPSHLADDDIAQQRQLRREQEQRGALAGADIAADQREAAVQAAKLIAPRSSAWRQPS